MVIVNCPLRQDDIIKIVENVKIEDKNIFRFVSKKGIRIFFECNHNNVGEACSIAHNAVFKTKLGKVLFYNVVDQNDYPWVKCE